MPQPRREDIPDDASPGDVLFELRLLAHSFDEWRKGAEPGIRFAAKLRTMTRDGVRALVILVPIAAIFAAWMSR